MGKGLMSKTFPVLLLKPSKGLYNFMTQEPATSVLAHRFKNRISRSAPTGLSTSLDCGSCDRTGNSSPAEGTRVTAASSLHQTQLCCDGSSTRPSNCSSDTPGELSVQHISATDSGLFKNKNPAQLPDERGELDLMV